MLGYGATIHEPLSHSSISRRLWTVVVAHRWGKAMPLTADIRALCSGVGRDHGTPAYLYDIDGALAHLQAFRAGLDGCAEVYYAMKANACPGVLQALRDHVDGLDLSSNGECENALCHGYDPAKMSLAGPGKSMPQLAKAVEARIGIISVESLAELRRLAFIVAEKNRPVKITLRVNPATVSVHFPLKMGGRPCHFGIPEESVGMVICEVDNHQMISLAGLHVYAGTQCLDQGALVEHIEDVLRLNARIAEAHRLAPQIVNVGGGFGIPYFEGQKPLEPYSIGRSIRDVIRAFKRRTPAFTNTRFVLELGRYVIGPFGYYLTRVIETKEVRGKRFAIVDGGMHHCFATTGNFGQAIKKNYPVSNLNGDDRADEIYEIVGPLCTPLDSLARGVSLSRVDPGDILVFEALGAYGLSASPIAFLSHQPPIELVRYQNAVNNGRA